MEVRLNPELEARLNELALASGRGTDELVQDAMASYLEELADLRRMLDGRYDGIKSGSVNPIDGEEAFARLGRKSEARRNSRV
jgi:predicted DNA-binding protein